MKKIIRDNTGKVIGWTDTRLGKGCEEFIDGAGYTYQGVISETMKSADIDTKHQATDRGELF